MLSTVNYVNLFLQTMKINLWKMMMVIALVQTIIHFIFKNDTKQRCVSSFFSSLTTKEKGREVKGYREMGEIPWHERGLEKHFHQSSNTHLWKFTFRVNRGGSGASRSHQCIKSYTQNISEVWRFCSCKHPVFENLKRFENIEDRKSLEH